MTAAMLKEQPRPGQAGLGTWRRRRINRYFDSAIDIYGARNLRMQILKC